MGNLDGRYEQSMAVLKHAKSVNCMVTKSSIMLGLGESDDEVKETMQDLRNVGVDICTLGQYLQVPLWNYQCFADKIWVALLKTLTISVACILLSLVHMNLYFEKCLIAHLKEWIAFP